ncbi:MAG: alpha/beta fold hydrolase [Acidimicrobiales bacterium]
MTAREPMFVELESGVELSIELWGSSDTDLTPWVLTHGLASNKHLWDGVAAHLAHRGHPVVTVDQRGHGQSSKPDSGYDMVSCANDLALLIEQLAVIGGIVKPAVAGQSWGGNVVLEMARQHNNAASVICCVDGGFIELRSRFPHWADAEQALAPPALLGTPVAQIEQWVESMASDWPSEGRAGTMANFEVRSDGTIAPWLTLERHLMVLRGLWEHDPYDSMPQVETPTLIVAAEDDNPTWPKAEPVARALELLPTARAEWFRPAHHDVHAQKPAEVAELLHSAVTAADFFS